MSINSINSIGNFYVPCAHTLKEETRRKLIALGIDPSTVSSESEAQMLIEQITQRKVAQFKEAKKQAAAQKQINNVNQTEKNSQDMISLLDYDGNMKRIILGL